MTPVLIERKGVRGLIDRARLERRIIPFEEENGLTIAVEYWLDGELVKRSVWHDSYCGLALTGSQATLGAAPT